MSALHSFVPPMYYGYNCLIYVFDTWASLADARATHKQFNQAVAYTISKKGGRVIVICHAWWKFFDCPLTPAVVSKRAFGSIATGYCWDNPEKTLQQIKAKDGSAIFVPAGSR